ALERLHRAPLLLCERRERREVARVALDGVGRQAAHVAEVAEIAVDHGSPRRRLSAHSPHRSSVNAAAYHGDRAGLNGRITVLAGSASLSARTSAGSSSNTPPPVAPAAIASPSSSPAGTAASAAPLTIVAPLDSPIDASPAQSPAAPGRHSPSYVPGSGAGHNRTPVSLRAAGFSAAADAAGTTTRSVPAASSVPRNRAVTRTRSPGRASDGIAVTSTSGGTAAACWRIAAGQNRANTESC